MIDVNKLPPTDKVVFGATVKMESPTTGEVRTWRIVGEDEANVEKAKISFKSPLGKALIGRRQGDEAVVPAPSGNQTWESSRSCTDDRRAPGRVGGGAHTAPTRPWTLRWKSPRSTSALLRSSIPCRCGSSIARWGRFGGWWGSRREAGWSGSGTSA